MTSSSFGGGVGVVCLYPRLVERVAKILTHTLESNLGFSKTFGCFGITKNTRVSASPVGGKRREKGSEIKKRSEHVGVQWCKGSNMRFYPIVTYCHGMRGHR